MKQGRRRPQDRLSRRDRQRLRHLARVPQRILAGALFHRCQGTHPPSPLRRRRVRRIGARDSAAIGGSGQARSHPRHGAGQATGARGGCRTRRMSQSPETYIGYERAEHFVSPGGAVEDESHVYADRRRTQLNDWASFGDWTIGEEQATLNAPDGSIVYRFHARDLHLVLGPRPDGKPVRFRVTIDGAAPGRQSRRRHRRRRTGRRDRAAALSTGSADRAGHRPHVRDSASWIPGVQAYAFTFG